MPPGDRDESWRGVLDELEARERRADEGGGRAEGAAKQGHGVGSEKTTTRPHERCWDDAGNQHKIGPIRCEG